jgi:hypothetical protein
MYTNINFKEGSKDQKFMIDFEKNLEYAQNLIYKRMQEARKRGNV